MGNSPSNSDTEDDRDLKNMDENSSENDENEKESQAVTELESIFDHATLRAVAAKIKEEIPENVIQQHRYQIIRWLDDREAKSEETVTLVQFCDFLINKPGVSREDAIRAFQQFDTDGSGVVEVSTILSAIKFMNGPNMMGELGKSIRMLQACSLTPGFVDVYSEEKDAVNQHAERILKYLLRNRAPTNCLPFPFLNGFNNTCSMRLSVLKNTFNHLKDAEAQGDIAGEALSDGEEVKLLNPCHSSLEVSSNASDAYRLSNGLPHTFWQSDGAARSHWIRLHIKSNVVIKNLSINVASADSSYMPEHITVTAGRSIRNMREIKETRIVSVVNGDVTLLKNAKCHYPIVQINIKRCRNDGCDTRIHGLKCIGYRVVKETGISVSDSAAMWFLQIMASTVTSAIPVAPALQKHIIEHSKRALEHIPPLSLSPASSDKPAFLSKLVLQEVEKFVADVAVREQEILADGVNLMLAFNLARGHIGGLLRTLKLLQENADLSLPCNLLMAKMQKARDTCWERSGHQLPVVVVGCDGGSNDENSKPENVLNSSWTENSQAYVSEGGKTKVNMFFKSAENILLTRIKLKVASGLKGPRRGLVFVYREKAEFKLEDHIERFQGYDNWAKLEYQFSVQVRNAGVAGKPDNPVAYFVLEDDCDEIDVPVDWHPVGQYILVKFLEPRHHVAGSIGVMGIKFYGFSRKAVLVEDEIIVKHPPNPEKKTHCTSLEIIQHVLTFLVDLSQDQAQRKVMTSRPEYLEFTDIPLDTLCELYYAFRSREEEKWQTCSLMTLQLLFCLLPACTSLSGESKMSAESLFQHLCKVVDSTEVDNSSKHYHLCKQLIIDGAAVFFSDKEARKKQLFSMMHKVETLSDTPSVMLVFQSLCQFFSSVDPRGLLDLPKSVKDNFDPTPVLEVMETMVMVTFHEFSLVVTTGQTNDQLLPLLQLVSSLQTSLLAWTWVQVTDSTDCMKVKGMHTASSYAILVINKAVEACKLLQKKDKESLKTLIPKIEKSFLGSIVRQLILMMSYMCTNLSSQSRVSVLKSLQPFNQEMVKLAEIIPEVFPSINSDHWKSVHTDDIVLRTWDVESTHNYENNIHHTQTFNCPGANKFVVEFDPRSETERRYDYLVFTDSKGQQMRFDQKVGNPKWPKTVQFVGSHLYFLFHSDGSNTEWGYKFKVTARGSPDMPLSWPFDLQLGTTKLMGRLCGTTLNANPVLPRDQLVELEEAAEQDILRSDLWTTLFRGGYMIGKLQRSLSGKYTAEESTEVLEFLWNCINRDDKAEEFLKKCKELCKGLQLGGESVEQAVISVFAALVWHTQQLRDDLDRYLQGGMVGAISDGLGQAYVIADSLRMSLASQRQKMVAELDNQSKEDGVDPANICKEKAQFLLKFAGLTKVQLKHELIKMRSKQTKKSFRREKFGSKLDISEKFPSFRLVLEFVQDQAWNTERVHNMLQERSQHAQAVSDVYMMATEIIRVLSPETPFQILVVLFLQEMLSFQDGFAKHYAEGLDGCGLELEGKVRHAFYTLVRRLTDAFHKHKRHELDKRLGTAYDFVQSCVLHLLDIQWQPYDLSFVCDVRLPDLFANIAKETVKMRDCRLEKLDEAEELKEYTQHMKWFDECSGGSFLKWYHNKEDYSEEEKKALQLFIARFCDLLEVEVNCDGCNVTLPGRRYRCVQCTDMDLCATCYAGGVEPEKHTDEHDIIHLVYKCNKCQAFITGTRIHCNVCEDFDLCLGCHLKGNHPHGHNPEHDITKYHQMKLKTSQETDSLIQGYIHQHVWMLFTLLAISMGDIIQTETGVGLDQEYASLAAQLQNKSINIVTHCLQKVPDDEEECRLNLKRSSNLLKLAELSPEEKEKHIEAVEERPIEIRQEEAFSIHSQERIMGLLGAMIPHDSNAPIAGSSFNFMTKEFLSLLFKISRLSVKKANIKEFVVDEMGPLKDKFLNILTKKRRFHTKQQLITDIEWAVNEVKRLDDERDDEGENSKGDDDKVDNEIDENNDTERKRVDNNIDNERKSLQNMTGDEIESYMINSDRDDNCDEDTGDEKDNGRKSGAVKMYDERKKLNKTNVTKKYEVDQRNSDRNLSKSDGCKTDDERNHSDKTVITKKSEVYQRDSERDKDYVPETDDEKESGGYLTDDEIEQYTTDIGRCKDYVPETDDEKESDGHLTDNEIKQYMTDSGRCKDYVPETDDEKESDGQSIDSKIDQYMTDSDRDKDYVPDTDDEKESEGNITDDEVYIPESNRVDDYVSETEDEIDNVSDDSNSLPNFLQFIRQEIEDTPRVVGTNQPESEVEKPYQRKLREDQIFRDSKYKNIYIKRYVKSKDGRSGLKSDERPYDTVHACCFCRQLFTHIQDHIEKKHADRSEVKEITELKKKLKLDNDQGQFKKEIKRRQDCLRYSGDHIHNQAVLHSKEGELLIQRKSCTKEDFHVDEYGPCPECQQWIKLESSVKIHQKICPKTAVKQNVFGKKALVWQAKHLIGKVEGSGSNMLRKDVIPKMRKDEISICAQNDHLICNLGDVWLSKSIGHELRKGKDSSFHMRLAAKLLMECRKKLNNSNLDMNDLLTMKNFDTIIEVTLQLCGKNEHDELLHPGTANKIGFDLGRLVGLKYGYCLRQKDTVGKEEADGFLKLMKIDWATKVTTHAGVLLRQRHFENRRRLPHPKDIEIVAKRLSEKLADYNYEQKTMYVQVARTALLRLMVYNRRRSGEIEELKMETYLRRNKEMDDVEQSLLGELTTTEKYLIKTQELMWIRGKRGKRVPVLIPPDAATALEYIVDPEVRRHAGLKPTNKYMFATKGDGVISASECINELGSEHAGDLIHPNRLTSTGYRAYMATMAQCLGLKDHQVQWLCSHLGHTENVHMTHYRFALDGIERMQHGKLLLIQDKNLLSKFRDTRLEDIEFEDVVSMETETPACANSKQTGTEMDVDAEITVPDFELDADDAVPILDKKAQKKKIGLGETGHEVNTRHLAMGLLGVLLMKCPVQVADNSVKDERKIKEEEESDNAAPGERTIKYLFSFGAYCLERSGLEWACSVARILQKLYLSLEWKEVLHQHLTECVQNLSQKPELSSIFAMFVMAGFPEVLTTGTLVSFNNTGGENKNGVVLKHYPDKHKTLLVDVKSRKRHSVPDKYIDCVSMMAEVWDSTNIVVFVNIVKEIVEKKDAANQKLCDFQIIEILEKETANVLVMLDMNSGQIIEILEKETANDLVMLDMNSEDVENLWVLSLTLKLLHNSLNCADNCMMEELYAPDFIQCLVSTASKGTGFSQQWLLKDLEVLSLMLYTNEGCTTHVKKAPISTTDMQQKLKEVLKGSKVYNKEENSDSDDSMMSDETSSSSSCATEINMVDELDMFNELDEKTQLMFRTLRSDLHLPISVLKVIYDMNDRNPDAVVKAILENFEGVSATPKDIVKKLSEKWDTILQARSPEAILNSTLSEKVIDTGIHFHPSLKQAERTIEKATEETAVDSQRLIQWPDNDVQDEIIKTRRTKSADLLKKELEKHGKTGSREYLAKVNIAMSVLYARQVLTSLLAHWPMYGHVINSNLLGCKEVQQIPCVLDLLNKTGSKENFQKVVQNLVQHCESESLVSIACTACQFMEEVTMSVVTKESAHNYKAENVPKEKIQLPGASYLTITFDSKCSTREGEDELLFSTSSDLQQEKHWNTFSGSSRGTWNSFQVPGDTIYYKFETESGKSDTHWGYKFTVTAGTRDSFETGYIILNDVLSSHLSTSLPLCDLWASLVYVATKQTGSQRLKTIQLLLKILQNQHRSEKLKKLEINLGLLKPLWQLYNDMTKLESEPNTILSPVSRALTELFLQVENLTMEWNITEDYLIMMQDVSELKTVVAQGIQRIAAVSIMIGYKNLAVDLVMASLKRKKAQEEVAGKAKLS